MNENDPAGMRMARIEWLLKELRYNVTAGVVQDEIDPYVTYQFMFRDGKNIFRGRFDTRPIDLNATMYPPDEGVAISRKEAA